MIDEEKIKVKEALKINELCEIIKATFIEYYREILPDEQLQYILDFINPDSIKDEILNQNSEYYFIQKDTKNIGFYKLQYHSESLEISRIYILKDHLNNDYYKTILNNIKNIAKQKNYKKIKTYVNKKLLNSIEVFKKLNFKIIKPQMIYLGSDYLLEVHLMELEV